MNINATLLGQFVLVSVLIGTLITAFLAKRKTQSPFIVTFVSLVLGFIPPLNWILIAVLALKQDLPKENA